MNIMKTVRIEKVTLNMGVGQVGDELKKAEEILKRISNSKPVQTESVTRNPTWGLRPGLKIGVKVTLRGKKAEQFLQNAFLAKDKQLNAKSFDKLGNFGFGIKEYIDLPGTKYDPKLGIRGLDVVVTLERPGYRVKKRKILQQPIGKRHWVTKSEAVQFIQEKFGVEVVSA